ncbi:MAG: hypothetical protein Q4D25_02570 [Bacteroidales bacterium]|nr:hypothetical protein [Bacteroidales bacterium]
MKKLLFIFALCFTFNHFAIAGEEYKINVLVEISYDQAQNYPRKWEISTYTYKNSDGYTQTRYFIFAPNIKHDSTIKVTRQKGKACPWTVIINDKTYYADFINNDDKIKVGDVGVLKYNGDTLYFVKD